MQGDLAQAREEVRRVSDAMQIENQKQINEVREKMLLEQAEMQGKFDTEIKDARKRHETQHEEMQKKYEQLNDSNQKVLNQNRDFETEVKDLAQKLDRKEYEFQIASNELKELRQGNQQLD